LIHTFKIKNVLNSSVNRLPIIKLIILIYVKTPTIMGNERIFSRKGVIVDFSRGSKKYFSREGQK